MVRRVCSPGRPVGTGAGRERVVGKSQEPSFLSLSLGPIRIPCKSWGPGFLTGGMKGLDKTTSKVPSNFTIGCRKFLSSY